MTTPAIILIILYSISLLLSANSHGEQGNPENFWKTLTAMAIMTGLLLWGGFFN